GPYCCFIASSASRPNCDVTVGSRSNRQCCRTDSSRKVRSVALMLVCPLHPAVGHNRHSLGVVDRTPSTPACATLPAGAALTGFRAKDNEWLQRRRNLKQALVRWCPAAGRNRVAGQARSLLPSNVSRPAVRGEHSMLARAGRDDRSNDVAGATASKLSNQLKRRACDLMVPSSAPSPA